MSELNPSPTTLLIRELLDFPFKVLRRLSWLFYYWSVRFYSKLFRGQSGDTHFLKDGFARMKLSKAMVKRLQAAFVSADTARRDVASTTPGFQVDRNPGKYKNMEDVVQYVAIGDEQKPVVSDAMNELATVVEKEMGTPWRILHVRSWNTRPYDPGSYVFAWHKDSYPRPVVKILIYMSDVTLAQGPTQAKGANGEEISLEGPAGTATLIDVNRVVHRQAPVTEGQRKLLEITLCHSFRNGHQPIYINPNVLYPSYPWFALPNA